MKAMILAAGMGTRLRPLTNHTPKALININGKPILYYIISKLKDSGVNQLIINVYHYAEQIIAYLRTNNNFGISIQISLEKELLDTGGGLKKAAYFFENDKPFILHNVDVISSINLNQMLAYHTYQKNMVTLAVKKRKTSRYFLFDNKDQLIGWKSTEKNETILSKDEGTKLQELSFLGIHVISPDLFKHLPPDATFSIIKAYLKLCEDENNKIGAYHCDHEKWFDLGHRENLEPVSEYLRSL